MAIQKTTITHTVSPGLFTFHLTCKKWICLEYSNKLFQSLKESMSLSKEEKRKALMQAASDVLLELGPQKTTLDDIASRAGMAKSSLYYYFKE
jgi:AraC-like DNA-binding protein